MWPLRCQRLRMGNLVQCSQPPWEGIMLQGETQKVGEVSVRPTASQSGSTNRVSPGLWGLGPLPPGCPSHTEAELARSWAGQGNEEAWVGRQEKAPEL